MSTGVEPVTGQPLPNGREVNELRRAGGTACATTTSRAFSEVRQAVPPAAPACRRFLRVALLAASFAPAGYGQFQLLVVNGSAEQPAPAVYNLGSLYPNQTSSAHFRLRNTSRAAATLTVLAVPGAGFTLNGPALPLALNPQAAVDFTVTFLAPDAGSYSAVLQSQGVSLLLLATVLPGLTYQVDTGAGLQPLGTGPVDFGSVELGSSAVRHFAAVNRMTVARRVAISL